MKLLFIGVSVVLVFAFVLVGLLRTKPIPQQLLPTPSPAMDAAEVFSLQTSAFDAGNTIPAKYTCDGENARVPLTITSVPRDTSSLAIVIYDPDAPGGNFVHWLAWNIPPETTSLPEGPLPLGVMEGINSFRIVGYRGPCPPSGTHRYIWRLYAISTILTLESTTTREDVEASINTYVIAQTELVGRYTR